MQGNQFYQYPSMRMGDFPNNHQHPSYRNVVEPPLLSYPSMRMGDLPNNHQHPSHRNVVEPPLLSFPPAPLSALTPYLPRNSRPVGLYTVALTDHPILPGPGPVEPSPSSGSYLTPGSGSYLTPGSGSHSGQADLGFYIQPAFNRQFIDPPIWWNAAQPFNSEQALADPPSSGQSFSFVKRLGTYRLPYDESHMSAPEMSKYLGMELEGRPPIEVHNLIERLYPDEVLPFPITSDILAHKAMETMWDNSTKVWKFGETYEEVQFSIILNNIAQALGQIFHLSRRRVWTARLRDCSPEFSGRFRSDPPCRLKPDLVLVPKDAVEDNSDDKTSAKTIVYRPINWDTIRAVAEITKSKVMPPRTKATINNKSFTLLITQPERIFVPFLTIYSCNPQRIQFRVTDRQGQTTCDFVLNGQSEVTALLLLRIVAAFAFGDTRLHGRDPTIVQERTFGFQITAGSITYRLAKLIHSSQSMIGRCTRVWSAVDPATQNRVIIKDGWLHHKRASSEGFYLKRLQAAGVSSIPTVIWEGAVGTDREASTSTIRHGFFPDDDCRIHRRIVLTPHGEPLTNFISLAELITALRDVVCAHRACIDNDVLHGDISLNNIVLVQQGGIYRKGYLIDFDYASLCSSNDGFGEHTGTLPFMAIEMLMKNPKWSSGNPDAVFIHTAKHDLESLFYVLLYLCTLYSGPGAKMKVTDLLKSHSSVPLLEWIDPSAFSRSFRSIGLLKTSHMINFETTIVAKISLFFRPIIPALIKLHEKMFPPTGRYAGPFLSNQITHGKMIESFDEMIRVIAANSDVPGDRPRKKSRPTPASDSTNS